MAWEYMSYSWRGPTYGERSGMVVSAGRGVESEEDELNRLGADGWEAWHREALRNPNGAVVYLKRRKRRAKEAARSGG